MSWIAGLVLLATSLWIATQWYRRRARRAERASRPLALVGAELAYMEKTFRIAHPIRLVAKVDRVYRLPDGMLVLVELKSRRSQQVRNTDIIQLSAQRMALQGATGEAVAPVGFVSTRMPQQRSVLRQHRVDLLDADEIVALAARRQAVLDGVVLPRAHRSKVACDACAFRQGCRLRNQ